MTLIALLLAAAAELAAPTQTDAIIVTAPAPPSRVQPPTVGHDDEQLIDLQPSAAGDTLRDLPGVSIRPNSRGETIARVRGAEERQTQVFLDGAPLIVPWDGRSDIGIIPAGLIGSVKVVKGSTPIEYGANAVAGVVDFTTRSSRERTVRASMSIGPMGYADGWAVATAPLSEEVAATLSVAGLTRDAQPIASHGALPFSQDGSNRRTNTDLDSLSLFGGIDLARGPIQARIGLLRVSAKRGIAPESDRDPAVDAPRYWRYPDIDLTQLNLAAKSDLGRAELRLTGWRQWFDQEIVQFTRADYQTVRAREDDRDDTLGGRAVLAVPLGWVDLRLVANGATSTHRQVDTNAAGTAGPRLTFRQELISLGGETDVPVGRGAASFGLAWDRSSNPRTGDKPAQPAKDALALTAALRQPLGSALTLTASAGRRNRFPSARELFGEALGRFVPNPDLEPEQSWLFDLDLAGSRGPLSFSVNPFLILSKHTIAQRIVTIAGVRKRQRFNLTGSTSFGVDVGGKAALGDGLDLDFGASLLRARAKGEDLPFKRLVQRPSFEAYAALDWQANPRLWLRGEARAIGGAVDLAPNGTKARLKPGQELNLRARYRIAMVAGQDVSIMANVDNILDGVVTPQLGLPLPGRSFRLGLMLSQ
ncbi:MAG: TonB-dependent receptor [Sphingomicrobium sp.]